MKRKNLYNIITQGISDMMIIWMNELKNVVKDQGILIFFIFVPLGYPLLYTYIYNNEVIREVPVAAVDDNRSSMSREFLKYVDANPDTRIVTYPANIEDAKKAMMEGMIYGIIYIPNDFTKTLVKGEQANVSIFCDLSGMLYYKALLTSATNSSLMMNKEIKISKMGNSTDRQDEIATAPIAYEDIALFNPQAGFASFLIPAVLILIIQQTLLLGIGLAAGTARENNRFRDLVPINRHYHGTLRIVLGKSLLYFMLYVIMSTYILVFVPKMFSLPQIGNPFTIAQFILPYLLSAIFFAMTCSVLIRHRETCMIVYIFTSVPLLFISGISWPGTAIPEFWKIVSYIFPSTFGINGFVQINNMGATIEDVSTGYQALWIQAGIYFITTFFVYRYQIIMSRRHVWRRYKEISRKKRIK